MKSVEEHYNQYVKEKTPTACVWKNMLHAFLAGGIICALGQVLTNLFYAMKMTKEDASSWSTLLLIIFTVILTGFNIFPKIAKYAGAGTLVPITGFANSVVAPAIEFKKEGQVFGIGCKIFTIAGPVILYGILSSWILGVLYMLLRAIGIMQ